MTTFLKVKNNAVGALSTGISDSATTLALLTGEGAKFPDEFPFPITIDNEILNVGNRSGDTLSSMTRGEEDTTPVEHLAGATVELHITAQQMKDIHDAVSTLEGVSHVKYTDEEAISAVPMVVYIPFGSEESYAP